MCLGCEKSETQHIQSLPPGWPIVAGMTLSTMVERTSLGPAFKGVHPRLGTEVLVTLLSPAIASDHPDLIKTLFANVRTVAQLQTPHLVRILDASAEGSTYYLVEESIRGTTAQACLSKKAVSLGRGLEEAQALAVLKAAAKGIAAAHANGLLHLGLAPQHILIPASATATSDQGLDFAAAKVRRLGLSQLMTAAEAVGGRGGPGFTGTPGYIAPELTIMGQKPSPAADVFSLGAILYALLTGRAPFVADDVSAVLMKTAHENPKPVTASCPDVSRQTVALLDRCIKKDPTKRPADAKELLAELEALQSKTARQKTVGTRRSTRLMKIRSRKEDGEHPGAADGRVPDAAQRRKPEGAENERRRKTRLYGYALMGGLGLFTVLAILLVSLLAGPPEPEGAQPGKGDAKKPTVAAKQMPALPGAPTAGSAESVGEEPTDPLDRKRWHKNNYEAFVRKNPDDFAEQERRLNELEELDPQNDRWVESVEKDRRALRNRAESKAARLAEQIGESVEKELAAGNLKAAEQQLEQFPKELKRTGASQRLFFLQSKMQQAVRSALERAEQLAEKRLADSDPKGASAAYDPLDGLADPDATRIVEARKREIRDWEQRGRIPSSGSTPELPSKESYFLADLYAGMPEAAEGFGATCREALHGDAVRAASQCQEAVQRWPRSAVYYYALAAACSRAGRTENAKFARAQAERFAQDNKAFRSRLVTLDVRMSLGQLNSMTALMNAIGKCHEALTLDERNPDAHFLHAGCLITLSEIAVDDPARQRGIMGKALAALRTAHQLDDAYPNVEVSDTTTPDTIRDPYAYKEGGGNPYLPSIAVVSASDVFQEAMGTAFVVKEDAKTIWVVTNYHVVRSRRTFALRYQVERFGTLTQKDARSVELLATDKEHDLALLKASTEDSVKALALRQTTSGLTVPMKVTIIGHPLGEEFTVVSGELANVDRQFEGARHLQLNANVTHGMSGGPVIDENGKVIGVVRGGKALIPGHCIAILSEHVRDLCAKAGVSVDLH